MDGLTKRQRQILNFITKEIEKKGYPPSIREIGKRTGISSLRGVTIHLDALEKKGYIKRNSSARSIKILKADKETIISVEVIKLPLVGRVAAGEPILAEENIEDWIPVPKTMVKNNKNAFLLKVNGDSMTGDYIMDGDLVVVKPQPVADNGDIVVAVIDDEATVKRFYREKDCIRLQPSNPKCKPTILKRNFLINGKVIGLLRI